MMIYGKCEYLTDIYDVKALLYVKKAQLDKCRKKFVTPSATTDIAQALVNSRADKMTIILAQTMYFKVEVEQIIEEVV